MTRLARRRTLALVIVLVVATTVLSAGVYRSNENTRTFDPTVVFAPAASIDAYGQHIEGFEVYQNNSGSWVQYGGGFESGDMLDWNASQFIRLNVYTWLNSTLVGATTAAEGKAYQRHNVTVTDRDGDIVFSQLNFTYVACDTGIDPVLWLYLYNVILNFVPQIWEDYLVTVDYQVYISTTPPTPTDLIIRPNGNGYNTAWTGDYTDVDEVTPNDSGDYIYTSTYVSDERETYDFQDTSATGAITSLRVTYRGGMFGGTGAYPQVKPMFRISGTDYFGSAVYVNNFETWVDRYEDFSTNPDTGVAWTWSDIDGLECGLQLVTTMTRIPRITQIYITVSYLADGTKSWESVPSGVLAFSNVQTSMSGWLVFIGLIMIAVSGVLLVRWHKSGRPFIQGLFYFIVIIMVGLSLFIGGIHP